MKSKLVNVRRKSDRTIMLKLVFEEKVLNVISTYAPHVGCEESQTWRRVLAREVLVERKMAKIGGRDLLY